MGDKHEHLCRKARASYVKSGFREARSPMPTYRPDIFAARYSSRGSLNEELVVEVELDNTIFLMHSQDQLILMDEFIRHRRKNRIKVCGVLAVPTSVVVKRAKLLLDSLFPMGTEIQVRHLS